MVRDLVDYSGKIVGQITLPDGLSESEINQVLSTYKIIPRTAQENAAKFTVKQRREYCDDLIERMKQRNIANGINIWQAITLHHKFRALSVMTPYGVRTIDLLNLIISGDVEVGAVCLMQVVPDDMTHGDDWLNSDLLAWIIDDMKRFLGWA